MDVMEVSLEVFIATKYHPTSANLLTWQDHYEEREGGSFMICETNFITNWVPSLDNCIIKLRTETHLVRSKHAPTLGSCAVFSLRSWVTHMWTGIHTSSLSDVRGSRLSAQCQPPQLFPSFAYCILDRSFYLNITMCSAFDISMAVALARIL